MGLLVQSYLPGPFFPPWASLSCCTNQAEPRHVVSPAKPSVSQTPVPLPTHTHTLSLSVTANSFISIRVTSRQVYPSHDSLSIQLSCKHPRSMTKEFINAIYVSTPTSMGWCPVWHSEDGRSILSIVFIQSSPHLFSLSFSHYLVR